MITTQPIAAATLLEMIRSGDELAIIDLREKGQFGLGHLLHAANIAYSDLEHQVPLRLPRLSVQICLIAADNDLCHLAADRLEALGYTRIGWLEGGVPAWKAAGGEVFIGEDVLPKAFGEIIEHQLDTPNIEPSELTARRAAGERIVVLDGRTPAEHSVVSIPDSISVPNGELVLRVGDLVPADATVVVTCAGRTRSIIGAQTLINAGLPNTVLALKGGTQGWRMAGLALDSGSSARYRPQSLASDRTAAELAQGLEALVQVPGIEPDELATIRAEGHRTIYLLDVRAEDEFTAGHLPGALHAPGGQLVQAVGRTAPVLRALIVLSDAAPYARARSAGHWLRQMGYDARLLEVDAALSGTEAGAPVTAATLAPPQGVRMIDGAEAVALADRAAVLDAGPGMAYRAAHAGGAVWAIRPDLAARSNVIAPAAAVLVMADSDNRALLVAGDLARLYPGKDIAVLRGGLTSWRDAGGKVASSPAIPADDDCKDYLFWAHDRQQGNDVATMTYFNWELGLPDQIDRDGTAIFTIAGKARA